LPYVVNIAVSDLSTDISRNWIPKQSRCLIISVLEILVNLALDVLQMKLLGFVSYSSNISELVVV